MSEIVTSEVVGNFIDGVAGKIRTPATVAGRLMEEAVELCLAAGLEPNDIMGHVTDSIFNQCSKISVAEDKTCFPSRHGNRYNAEELGEEMADVQLLLRDLEHITGHLIEQNVTRKWAKFITKTFWVSPKGVGYAIKNHIR